ncbi:MAG: hypothetical protein JXK95_09985 [Bacteroidales bacterium]|nr:hypothetical protein [Bacteroidales bacterium]
MTRYYCILIFLFPFSFNCIAEEPGSFPSVDETDLPDARFETPKTYTGASLFGHINGAAELYLEYGFSGAWVNEISLSGEKYSVEIYRMNGPEEAFGIYSVSRFQCKSTPSLSPFSCKTPYQLQLCSGSFYINISNNTGNIIDSVTSLKIGEAIVRKIKESPADITSYLPGVSHETINREAVLAKGMLGIMNGVPDQEAFFRDVNGYCVVILRGGEETILSVRFSEKKDMKDFMDIHNWNPETISDASVQMPTGETIIGIADNHLLIKIKE